MIEHIRAIFRAGAFYPISPCAVPEEAEVDLTVESRASAVGRTIATSDRAGRLRQITQRMRNNPLPVHAPRFTRDELYERR